jgi:hypothetical protein
LPVPVGQLQRSDEAINVTEKKIAGWSLSPSRIRFISA